MGWELVELPATSIGLPPAPIDVRTAVEVDQAMADRAQKLAEQGARVARDAGFEADGLAVAEDVDTPVAEMVVSVASERGGGDRGGSPRPRPPQRGDPAGRRAT